MRNLGNFANKWKRALVNMDKEKEKNRLLTNEKNSHTIHINVRAYIKHTT